MEKKTIVTDNVEWEYLVGGMGRRAILMFHGAVGGAESMQLIAGAFTDEYRIIAPTIANVQSLGQMCSAVRAILDREEVGKVIVFGGSFGGAMAQAFFGRYRESVEHLILLSTGAPDRRRGAISEKAVKLLALLPFSFVRALMKMELSRHLRAPASSAAEVAERVRLFKDRLDEYLTHQLTKELFLSRMKLFIEFAKNEAYRAEDSGGWPGRMLIIESTDDPMINEKERRRLKALYPQAAVYTFSGTGHLIPLLKLDEMVGAIKNHLNEGSQVAL